MWYSTTTTVLWHSGTFGTVFLKIKPRVRRNHNLPIPKMAPAIIAESLSSMCSGPQPRNEKKNAAYYRDGTVLIHALVAREKKVC
jgi:hypothetical protein